ncbi:PREDICTED: trans-2-enoyl-CoA reductase, mitochondrial-like [Amphimedon queenslandica]|uniref:Enoyl-[acyl-carrier-protein] reductase, mitochondrial n=2 Tax=Amphimedon queenslandica TaxID=400682 RepID=A0AAN0IE86_AMPQE|nr:PREDICTED: trans-2-enoyl-CoA reductase, mitochondrial-like [Amphimedon queenslandica]|eukprot:XP_003386702.2 PREDICTED: trans-2-enoyl-CoA reductase, mitochondrial-like [Amphimedon queenslandica]
MGVASKSGCGYFKMASFGKVIRKNSLNAFSRVVLRRDFTRGRHSLGLVYGEYGDPGTVLKLEEIPVAEDLKDDEIEVDMLCAPVNPSDMNQIQGTYPFKSELPAVGGNEGVGLVRRCGLRVTGMKEGDWVIPILPGVGTWRSTLISNCNKFLKVSSSTGLDFAATLQVNPPTAYRMLKDFVSLQPGDTLIQNGANSGVGQAVIQLAAAWDISTINVVRTRPDSSDFDVINYLKELGATEVVTEEFLHSHKMKELIKGYSRPALGLNCVGGDSSTGVAKLLKEKGTLITYGGMSRKPVTIATSLFIFKQLTCIGYWNGLWLTNNITNNRALIEDMFHDLCTLGEKGLLRAPRSTKHELINYKNAINESMKPFVSSKQLLMIKN